MNALQAILAQSEGESTVDVIGGLIGGAGVAGIWIVAILMGKMHPDSSMKRERERADKAEARVDELTQLYISEVLPALNSATQAVAATQSRGT